ncbi:VCBS repeat-containing protein [Corallococcus sp. M34]|uniref:VCBS repeat-containing protein n=1 Tax=Citreicoccus inhibens TaxID=2849499 RepID=UPI001C2321EA|nr:VCBS repeat-containing protein [Citreicoccus inhibens]MBU8896371.1 VCBS repeat-containing protein [Citreicoccus inhibens]
MKRITRAAPLLALLAVGCRDGLEPAAEVPYASPCDGLAPMKLTAEPANVRVGGVVVLSASGGSGHYRFVVMPGGSSGEVRGDRFVAGATPGNDVLVAQDAVCAGDVSAAVKVVASFNVAPARAAVRPATSFKVEVSGLVGSPTYSLVKSGSGATLTADGVYTAGAGTGLDLVSVRDAQTGDEVLLQYDVRPDAKLVGDPGFLALPAGGSVPLATRGGSDTVTWTKVSGPGVIAEGRLSVEASASGVTVLKAEDRFTQDVTNVSVRVLTELIRPTQPHGRLSDAATLLTADFDGDGTLDLAVGQRESDLSRPSGGAVFIFKGTASGLPAKPTWVLSGDSDTALFGDMLAAGDLDGDGRAELAVSSPGADVTVGDSGAVYLYTFKSGEPQLMRGPLTGLGRGGFGTGLAIADVDGDGDLDLLVGSPVGDLAATSTISKRGVVDFFVLERGKPIPDLPAVRLGGTDLTQAGGLVARSNTDLGRAVVMADFNNDGRPDLAALGKTSRYNADGSLGGQQISVSVFFARASGSRFNATPDVYVLPSNLTEGLANEGTWRLGVIPGEGSRPPLLLVLADRADSPDLRTTGGVQSGADSGGAFLFDLTGLTPTGEAAATPVQLTRDAAYARIYGDVKSINAGRSWAVMDVDGVAGPELLLGAPYGTAMAGTTTLGSAGRVLAFPLATLTKGSTLNKPLASLGGAAKAEVLGAGLAVLGPSSAPSLVGFAGRASSDQGAFTGRVDVFQRAGASLAEWTRTGIPVPAKSSVERYGEAVAVARLPGDRTVAVVGAPGFSGPGVNGDGADLSVGRAYAFNVATPTTPTVAGEGAGAPLTRGRSVGTDVTFTDFNGDGRKDLVMSAPTFVAPGMNSAAAERDAYAQVRPECVAASTQSVGGVLVSLGQADGSFTAAYRLWAPTLIAGCTPDTDAKCKRASIGRGVVGGFDFNGDGKEDLGVLRDKGFDLYLGRAPDDATLAKLTMGCDPVYTWPTSAQQTSAPAALGDLDGDGCSEVSWRYSDGSRSGIVILFGYDAGGTKCGGRTQPSMVRVAGDGEVNLNMLGLGVATTRAGRFLGGTRDYLAVSAASIPVNGVTQPAVLLLDVSPLVSLRPTSATEALVSALDDRLSPTTLVHRSRAVGFGASLAGGKDLTGDGVPDLIVGATGASVASDGGGAVFFYAGGPQSSGALSPFLTVVGDAAERGMLGQSLSLAPVSGTQAAVVVMGASRSYRTGTQNGTAFVLPLPFEF